MKGVYVHQVANRRQAEGVYVRWVADTGRAGEEHAPIGDEHAPIGRANAPISEEHAPRVRQGHIASCHVPLPDPA